MEKLNRWVLLEHNFHPWQPFKNHFDLLLEDGLGCRTWRLETIPVVDGPSLEVTPLPAHGLEWLEKPFGEVSGGRGWAKRVKAGFYSGSLPNLETDPLLVELQTTVFWGTLEILKNTCKLRSRRGLATT